MMQNAFAHPFPTKIEDFADLADAMASLDLVISVDTGPAHLAGAIGVPVWTLLCASPYVSPIFATPPSNRYPSMRYYRQSSEGDWDEVITRVMFDLAQIVQRRVHA